MGLLIRVFFELGLTLVGSYVARIITALGIGIVSYVGVNASLNWLKSQAVTAALGLPPNVVGMLSTMRVGESINIVFSAILAKAVINGLTSDTVKRWRIK